MNRNYKRYRRHRSLFIELKMYKKKENRKIKYFVKWLGNPEKFNSWIEDKDLK
jgi:hypothetical protein